MTTLIGRLMAAVLSIVLCVIGIYAISIGYGMDPLFTPTNAVLTIAAGLVFIAMGFVLFVIAFLLEG